MVKQLKCKWPGRLHAKVAQNFINTIIFFSWRILKIHQYNEGHPPPDWNKDWKPGPYPVTPEERQAAARKYGLRPDEYRPVPDDGIGAGDYPDLPLVSAESRDPYNQWDYPEHRRNFGEPVSVQNQVLSDVSCPFYDISRAIYPRKKKNHYLYTHTYSLN